MGIVIRPHRTHFVEWASNRKGVVVLSGDLTSSCEVDLFRDTYPDRFFSMGMAEQNMMGFAAGLAREGFEPYVHTFAVFITRRPFDQVAMSIAYPNLPVRLIGFLPGITTPGGVTHQAIDDIALMRAIPNMTVLETGDATDIEGILDAMHEVNGPVYVRMLRGEVIRLFAEGEPFVINRARVLSEGDDLTIISSGICTEEALRATQMLRERGLSFNHLHVHTLKPFTDPTVMDALKRTRLGVITMENHLISGGLGSAVAEVMAENGIGARLVRMGLKDRYAHGASRAFLMAEYSLDALSLVHAVEGVIGRSLKIDEKDLQSVRMQPVHSLAKAEAL